MKQWASARPFVPASVAACLAFVAMLVAGGAHPTTYINFVYLADALIHGHVWTQWPGEWIDAVPYHGRAYIVEGPVPAVLLIPAVLIWGTNTNQTVLSMVLASLAVFAAFRLCERTGLGRGPAIAATLFVFFGTSLFASAARGDVWYTAHVSAFCFALLALGECAGRGRPWLVALWVLGSGFSRTPLLVLIPVCAFALWYRDRNPRVLAPYAATLAPGFLAMAAYDQTRWGTIFDPGFAIWFRVVDSNYSVGQPMFSLAYLRLQTGVFVWTFPRIIPKPPFFFTPLYGFSWLVTSAPFLYAARAGPGAWPVALWCGAVATIVPALTYYDNGEYQYGMRHALDFEPFLFALLLLALVRRPSRIVVWLLIAFAIFGAFAGVVWLNEAQ